MIASKGNLTADSICCAAIQSLGSLQNSSHAALCNSMCVSAMNQATSLGYNTSIICPNLGGDAQDWARFHAVIAGEILGFTAIAAMPACIISGGSFTIGDEQNFLQVLIQNVTFREKTFPFSLQIVDNSAILHTFTNSDELGISSRVIHSFQHALSDRLSLAIRAILLG